MMNSTFGAPSRARFGAGHAGFETSKVRPITPGKAWPDLYSLSVIVPSICLSIFGKALGSYGADQGSLSTRGTESVRSVRPPYRLRPPTWLILKAIQALDCGFLWRWSTSRPTKQVLQTSANFSNGSNREEASVTRLRRLCLRSGRV